MKKAAVLIIFLAVSLSLAAQDLSELGGKLEEYTAAISGESVRVKNQECDFLISTCQLPETRQYAALRLYDHYTGSKLLGDEDVAVHIASEWFLSGKVPMKTEADLLQAKLFVRLNGNLLLGMKAPSKVFRDENLLEQSAPSEGRCSVLYFYDTSCSSCKVETARLDAFVRTSTLPVDFYAIYTGTDEAAWARYRATSLRGGFIHLFDPSGDAILDYGVVKTPRMFLIAADGTILGRGIDTPALKALLEKEFSDEAYEYGSDGSTALFSELLDDSAGAVDVLALIETIRGETLAKGDTLSWKRLTGDLLYYLAPRRGEGLKMGEERLVEKILAEDFRTSPEDSAAVIPLALLRRDLLSKARVGTKVPAIAVEGKLLRRGKAPREGTFRLRRLRNARITFYTEGCASCRETLAEADSIAAATRLKVLTVDVDALPEAQAHSALDAFDLSTLPYTFTVSRGKISRRYL